MNRIRQYSYGILALSLLLLVLTTVLPSTAALSAEGVVRRAWQRVQYLGVYDFATELAQTQTPGPTLANVGRSSSTQTVYMEGHTDQPAQLMEMSLWQNGGNTLTGRDGLEIRIADGKAYGRAIGEESWRAVSDFTDAFAPGEDPLGYLAGAENIREVGQETREGIEFTRYAFDLNGPRFAAHMRDQMEQELIAKGELPPGVELSMADEYVAMSGEGEIWVDSQDLPLRLTLHVTYPEETNGDRVSADIRTDFSGYPEAAAANRAGAWLAGTLHLPRTSGEWQQTAHRGGMALGVLGLVVLLITAANSRKLYIAVAVLVIVSTVVTPLLQSQQVAAFSEKASAERTAQEQEQAEAEESREYRQQVNTSNWNANADPLAAAEAAQSLDLPTELAAAQPSTSAALLTEPMPDPASDADGDGLTYAQETALGTIADNADTDGDGLTDNIEVQGFSYAGKLWYSDPTYYDTDMDGITDVQECPQRQRESQNQLSPDALCQDTDSDGTPDLFDRDSDNDGLPDKLDYSPTRKLGAADTPFTYETPFHLIINDAQADNPLVVDFQLRPQNPEHLTYVMNVLDWPDGDTKGQVQRAKGNHATFADVAPGGAAREANGDMRLIPMLEIEMNGDTLPLPLTTTLQATAYLENEIAGQIAMTQQPGQPIQLAFTFADTQPYTMVIYADNASCPGGTAAYTFTAVHDGDVRMVSGISLNVLADGKRLMSVSGGGQQVCANLGNVINGPYSDRAVDLAQMQSYGIAVREKTDGGLLAYVPLSVIADETGGGRVGFLGRMYYQPGASWGDAHQMRMVWLVDALVDRCKNRPASDPRTQEQWCSDPNNWDLNQTQVVQTYSDEWFLAGMIAREDHGLDMAVVFEDPATDSAPDVDEYLWHLTEGLGGIFLTASDTNNDGQRDLTIPEIVRRFDSQHNAGVSDEQRWDIPQNALRVLTYAFANADEVATLPMTHTRQLLQTYFTAPDGSAKVSAPTLLFAQEQRARYANLGMSAEAVRTARLGGAATDNQLTLSIPGDVLTQAVYQWAPYHQVNGVWEAMPLDNYFQRFTGVLQPILESDTEAYANLTPEERTKALNAQGVLAQGYYLSVYQSMSAVVQKGATLIKPAVPGQDSDYKYVKTGGTVGKVIITMVKSLVKTFIKTSISVLKLYVGDFLIKNSGDLLKLLVQCVTPLANLIGGVLSATAWFFKYLTQIRGGEGILLMVGIAIILAAVVAVACLLAMVSTIALLSSGAAAIVALILSPDTVATFFAIVKLVCSVLTLIVTIITTIISIVKAVIAVIKAAGDLTAAINIGALVLGAIVAIIAWAIGVVISVGLFVVQVIVLLAFGYNLFSPEVLTLVADLIAELALSIVTLLIGLIPIVGAVLMGLMGVIDAIVGVVCTLIPGKDPVAARWFCGGITGFFKVAISSAIYSYAVVVSMKNPQRLQLTSLDTSLADPKQGFKVGQKMTFKVGISNEIDTITVWEAAGAGLAYAVIYPQLEGIDNLVRQSTFAYRLQPTKNDFHQDLKLNQNPQIWRQGWHKNPDFLFDPSNTPGAGPYIMTATTASQLTFNQAGMNVTMPAYLSEGYALPAHECWLLGLVSYGYVFFTPKATEFCTIKTSAATNHIDLSSVLEYDIFPATLDEFYALAARDGGYALAWSQTSYPVFPRLKDADGDGLLNAADGGSDPDDRRWDADGDGLSDYFEAQKGTPPLSADADGDGLSDAEELIRKTDPLKADSDGDGLTDADELAGWEFVYGFDAAGQPLRTWVWPDPQVGDADGDGLNDAREKAFGFNPRVPDEGNALAYTAALDEAQPGGGWQASDGVVKPGDTLRYTGAVENRLNARYAQGLFSTDLPAGITGNVAPQNFILQPLEKTTVSGQVQVAPTAASGNLALAQTAGALVTDPRTASGGASLLLHFEEATGATTFLDESGSFRRHNAACAAGSCPEVLEENGIFGRYAFFNNTTVTVADAPDLRSGAFTLSLWYYWRDGSNGPVFLTSKGVGNLEIQLGNGAGDPRLLRVIAAGHPGATLDVLDGAVREAWTHLVVVYTGSEIHVYSNGVLLRSRTDITGGTDLAANTAPLTLGRRSDGGYPFLGSLDEVRLYPRALTAAEAQALYRRPLMKFDFNRPPADNRWRDESGLKYDAYCNSPICLAVQSPEGIYQNAIFFPAPGWGLWTAMPIPFDFTAGQVTLSAWVHPRFMPSSNATLIGSLGYGDRNAAPSLRLNGQTVLFGYGDGVAWREVQWDNVVSLGDWNHLAVTLAGQTAQLYVNGVPQATRGMGGAPRAYRDMMVIGRDFMGLLDEVTLYAHTLTAEEVLAEYRRYAVALDLPLDDAPGSRTFQDATQQSSAACSGASCPVSGVPGRINQAATFDGVNDAVRVANSAALRPAIFSLSAWFQWDDMGTANVQFITGKGLEHFEIHTGGDAGVNGLRVIPAGYTRSSVDVANFIQPGWNHVVVTYDGRNVFVYRNGVQVGNRAGIADSYDPAMDAAPFWVGCRNGGGYPFHGAIDAVQLYNRVLTAAEVQQLYQSAPLFLLRFDEGVGATQFTDAFSSKTAACAGATCPVSVRGQLGNALEFDGMDDRVQGDLASNATDNVSLMAWIRWAGVNGHGQMIAHNGNSSTDGYGLYLAADGTLHLLNGGVSLVAAALKPPQDSWTHVAAVRENGVWKLYVNGSLAPLAGNPIPRTPTAAFYVGANNAGGDAFNGRIDHVALYVTALSGVDVDAIYRYQSQWVEERQSFALTVDADKPTSTLQSAAPYRPNRDVVLHVAAADATSAVDKVELGVNGNWTTAPTCRDADAAWCPTFDPTALNGEGVYTLQTRATDRAGNVETPGAGATFYVDATPPTVGATLPTGAIAPQRAGDLWTVALAGTVNDPALPGGAAGSGVASVHVALYDASGVTAGAGEQAATVTGAAWAATYAFPAAPTGVYTVSVTASDAVGNARTTAVGVLHLDGAAPTASLDKTDLPTNTITSTLTLRGLVGELPSLTGQVFHLALEEDAGATTFYDSNGRGVNGACSGATCPTAGVAGQNGRALDFDGVDDYLTVTPPVTPTEFTLSLWFQWDDLNSDAVQFLAGKGVETFEIQTGAGNRLRVIPAGYPETHVDVPGFVQAGWNHVALTYDGSTVIVYRNGAPVGSRGGVTGVDLLADATPFNIGRRGDGTYPFDGQIDDVRLFDRVLEPAEIALLAQSQVAGVSKADVAFTPAMPGSPLYNESAPAGQVLHLPLESAGMDANVSILRDVSGSNAHGGCEGTACPTLGTNSPAYVGAQFDGVDDLVTVSDPGGLSLATFSVGGWVRPDQIVADWQVLIAKGNPWGHYRNYGLWIKPNELTLDFGFKSGHDCADYYTYVSQGALPLNAWTYVLMTYDGTALKLYLNGQLDSAVNVTAAPCQTAYPVQIGRLGFGGAAFHGALDDVRVFNRALTAAEIQTLYWGAGPEFRLDFEETSLKSGDGIADSSARGHNGLLYTGDAALKGITGQVGQGALALDGVDDSVSIAGVPALAPEQYTLSLWFQWDDIGSEQAQFITARGLEHFEMHTGGGAGVNGLRVIPAGYPETSVDVPNVIQPGWNHVVVTYDGSAVYVYRNGVLAGSRTGITGGESLTADSAPFLLGRRSDGGGLFDGALDDVRLYARILSAAEIHDLYVQGWQTTTLTQNTNGMAHWNAAVPGGLEGNYQITLRGQDAFGNAAQSVLRPWQGTIDTFAPRVSLTKATLGAGATLRYQYTCTAEDFALTEGGFVCPCAAPDKTFYQSPWYQAASGAPALYRLTASCTVSAQSPVAETLTACDKFGNCATTGVGGLVMTPLKPTAVTLDTAITEPADGDVLATTPVTVSGAAYALAALRALTVTADAAVIHTQTWGGTLTETTWSFAWTPAAEGAHTLTAIVRDATGAVLTQTTPITVYVDTTAPTVAIVSDVLTTTHYRPSGEVGLTGTVADAGGVQNVIVEVTAADGTFLHGTLADVAGTTWRAPWIVDVTALPAGETYTITAVAADLAGRVVTATCAITVDVTPPATMTLGLSGNLTLPPATVSLTWTASSDASGLGDYRGVWQTWLTDTFTTTAFTHPASGPRAVTATVQEGQKLVAQVAAQDAYGNQTWQTYGPVYADSPATPDYAALDYRGWMETGCTALGTDARIRDKATADASLKAAQQFYLTWDSAALRMTWTGANWDSDGDLFIYLDTQPGGATQAYNPYPATISNTAILLPVRKTLTTTQQAITASPRAARSIAAAEQMEADALVWVRDSATAVLMVWNGSAWVAADGLAYAFDATRDAPTTDLRVPFSALGITDPATATLALVAFATEDDALRLWATMPPLNSVNSERILNAKLTGDVERFALTHRYDWATLGDGVCVNASQAVGRSPHAPQAAPQAYNADVRFTFQAQPEGIAYSVLEDNHFFLMDNLDTFADWTDWDAWDAEFCAEFPDDPECQRELEAKPAGTRAPQQGGSGLDFNAQNGLGTVQDTAHPPVGDGDIVTYTLRYTNRGTARATGLIADILTWGPVRLPDAQEHYVDETEETYYLTLDLGDLDPGQTLTATFTGQIDVTCDITNNVGWATLDISLYDDSTSLAAPLDWVYIDHKVDQSGPLITLQADPALVAPGVNTLHGLMVDESSVATITLEIEDSWGVTSTVGFHDATPDDGRWEYTWDIGDAEEDDWYYVAVMAEDVFGQAGEWSRWYILTVDATAPALTFSSATEAALEDGIIGPAETAFSGALSDNRLAADVQACQGTLCDSANTLLDAATVSQTTFAYDDAPAAPLPINAGAACEGGTPIVRTFNVSDAFVVADVAVGLNITHEFRYDVDVTLISPAGTEVNILWDGTDAQNYDVLLSDDALALNADDWQDHDPAAPYYETVIRPDEPLEFFAGEESQGQWQLTICDYSPEEDDGAYNRSRLVLIADVLPENTAAAWSYTMPLSDSVDGALQTATFYGLDSAGNRSAATVRTFLADNVALVVTVTTALPEIFWGAQTPVLGGLASDGTGVANVTIVGQTPAKTLFYAAATESAAGQWQYILADAWPGTYTLWVQAEDLAGNMTTVGPYIVLVKGAPLTLAKTVTPTVDVQPGATVTYTLVLHNGSAETVSGLVISDVVTSTLHTLMPTPPGTLAIILGNTLTWGPLAIAAGDTYTFSFTAVVTETVGSNVLVTNQATYYAPTTGPGVSTPAAFFTAQGNKIYLPLVIRNG